MSKKDPGTDNKWKKITEEADTEEKLLEDDEEKNPAISFTSREELEEQLNVLEGKYNDTLAKLQYIQAEFDNFRKRSERDVSNAYKYGPEKLVNELLGLADSLEKTLEHLMEAPKDLQSAKEGVELTYKMLQGLFEKFSVKQINPQGEAFNPTWHEAMTMQEMEGTKPGTVLNVLQKGYSLHERLLRPALVIVAK